MNSTPGRPAKACVAMRRVAARAAARRATQISVEALAGKPQVLHRPRSSWEPLHDGREAGQDLAREPCNMNSARRSVRAKACLFGSNPRRLTPPAPKPGCCKCPPRMHRDTARTRATSPVRATSPARPRWPAMSRIVGESGQRAWSVILCSTSRTGDGNSRDAWPCAANWRSLVIQHSAATAASSRLQSRGQTGAFATFTGPGSHADSGPSTCAAPTRWALQNPKALRPEAARPSGEANRRAREGKCGGWRAPCGYPIIRQHRRAASVTAECCLNRPAIRPGRRLSVGARRSSCLESAGGSWWV